jgi:hypothetical protein
MLSVAPKVNDSSRSLISCAGAHPLVALQAALAELPAGSVASSELHSALATLDQFDRGGIRELSGLAAWLDFLRDPWQDDGPLDDDDRPAPADTQVGALIRAALDAVRSDPEPPRDSLDALDEILKFRGPGVALAYKPDAAPPFDKFQALLERERGFARTWDHKRCDLADAPLETYEAALAGFAVADGWNNQEIIDLLIAHRARWLENPVPNPAVIVDARRRAAHDAPQPDAAPDAAPAPVELSPAIQIVRRGLGIPVAKVRKLGRKHGIFELVLEDGDIVELGTASAVQSHREVSAAVLDAVGRTIPPLKGELWRKVVDAIAQAATVEETGNSAEEETLYWLRSAARDNLKKTLRRDNPAEAAKVLREATDTAVFLGSDELFVCLPALLKHVLVSHGNRVTWPDMALRLRRLGFRRELISARDKNGVAKMRLWTSPRGFTVEE